MNLTTVAPFSNLQKLSPPTRALSDRFLPIYISLLALAILVVTLGALQVRGADTIYERDAVKKVQEAGQTAGTKMDQIWRRIDEARLKNRTPDQLVAWVIMGLLVSGVIHQFSKLKKGTTVLLGLAGAFLGGIIANVTQVDLGMGPVLIRYEEMLASLLGGVLIVLTAKFLTARRVPKK